MTKRKSYGDDNGGRCESCDKPLDEYGQTTVSVFLGGGLGWGTMWVCMECLEKRRAEGKSTGPHDRDEPKSKKGK